MSRRITYPLYFALVGLATLFAGGSDTSSVAEGHRQVSSEHTMPLKGAWREAARLRLGLPELPLPDVPSAENFAGQIVFLSVASASKAPTTLDRSEPLWDLEIKRSERMRQDATPPTSTPAPPTAEAVVWPDLPDLKPIPLPVLALLTSQDLKGAQPRRPAPEIVLPKKAKAIPTGALLKSRTLPQADPNDAEPAPVTETATARAKPQAAPRPAAADVTWSNAFENLSKSAP